MNTTPYLSSGASFQSYSVSFTGLGPVAALKCLLGVHEAAALPTFRNTRDWGLWKGKKLSLEPAWKQYGYIKGSRDADAFVLFQAGLGVSSGVQGPRFEFQSHPSAALTLGQLLTSLIPYSSPTQ